MNQSSADHGQIRARTGTGVGLAMLIAFATVLYAVLAVHDLHHPLNQSPFDGLWALTTGAVVVLLMVMTAIGRSRVLAWTAGLALLILVAIVVTRGGSLTAVAGLIWIGGLAVIGGDLLLRSLAPRITFSSAERIGLGGAVGLTFLTLPLYALAVLGVLTATSIGGLLIGLTLGAVWFNKRFPAPWRLTSFPVLSSPLAVFALVGSGLALLGSLIWALAPETLYDALVYQLTVPDIYLRHGGLVEIPNNFRSYWVGNTGMHYAIGLGLTGQPLPELLHWFSCVLLVVQTYALANRLFGHRTAWIAAFILATTPYLVRVAGSAYMDCFAALFVFGAVSAVIAWWFDRRPDWWGVAGVLMGSALASKMNAIFPLIPVLLLVVFGLVVSHRRYPGRTRFAVRDLVVPLVLIGAPWLVVRWLWTGNPIFPFLNRFFQSPGWPLDNTQLDRARFYLDQGPIGFLRLPWDLIFNAPVFADIMPVVGVFGLAPLLALPWGWPLLTQPEKRRAVLLSLIAWGAAATWFISAPVGRYLFPTLPVLALLAACNLVALWRWLSERQAAARVLAVLALIVGGSYLWATRTIAVSGLWQSPERYPFSVALNGDERTAFLSRTVRTYDAMQFLNQRSNPDTRLLMLAAQDGLYFDGEQIDALEPRLGLRGAILDDPALLDRQLRGIGIDYILTQGPNFDDSAFWANLGLLSRRDDFYRDHTKRIYNEGEIQIYELLDESAVAAGKGSDPTGPANFGLDRPCPGAARRARGTRPDGDFEQELRGKGGACLAAVPNPAKPGSDGLVTTLVWQPRRGEHAQILVSRDDDAEQLLAEGEGGTTTVDWLEPGSQYRFRLYAGADRRVVLAEVLVTTTPEA